MLVKREMPEKIKAIYIGGFELPDKNAAAHRVLCNAKIIRDIGGDVVFVGVNRDPDYKYNYTDCRQVNGFKAYAIPYPSNKKQWINYLTSEKPFLDIIKDERINTVIFYNFPAVAMRKISNYCNQNGIKCIADVTEWYSAKKRGISYFVFKGLDTSLRMRLFHKKMDAMIVISSYLERYYRNCNNVILIPPLVDLTDNKWKRTIKENSGECLKLIYAGSPVNKDRVDILIKALKLIERPCSVEIVGITKEQYIKHFPEDKLFIENNKNIYFRGRVSHIETIEHIKNSDYACYFREKDRMTNAGFSTKFVESISCGTPVITNNTSDVLNYAKNHSNAIIVDSIDTTVISKAIESANKSMFVDRTLFDYRNYYMPFIGMFKSLGYYADLNEEVAR